MVGRRGRAGELLKMRDTKAWRDAVGNDPVEWGNWCRRGEATSLRAPIPIPTQGSGSSLVHDQFSSAPILHTSLKTKVLQLKGRSAPSKQFSSDSQTCPWPATSLIKELIKASLLNL